MHRFRFVLVLVAFVFTACDSARAADDAKKPADKQPKFELRDGDRVVFLGNTLVERAQKYGYWETMLTARYPNKNITFRNLGWSGDTVWAESRGMFDPPAVGYKRMIEHVGRLKPTVIFVGYGNNEAFAGKAGLPAFIKQYNTLLDDLTRVSAESVRFVILSPILHESLAPRFPKVKIINTKTRLYADDMKKLAVKRDCVYIDLIDLQQSFLNSFRGLWRELTYDGMHLDQEGYRASMYLMRAGLKLPQHTPEVELSADGKVVKTRGATVGKTGIVDDIIKFSVMPNQLLSSRPRLKVNGVLPGEYKLTIDGQIQIEMHSDQLTKGIAFKRRRSSDIEKAQDAQVRQLQQTIIAKNRLYFYRWRPQNITYLTGFRKHEQGQNAKEIAEFDKLIVAKEKEINKLKKPVAHTYKIIRVKKDK